MKSVGSSFGSEGAGCFLLELEFANTSFSEIIHRLTYPRIRSAHDINPRLYLNSVIALIMYFDKASEEELLVLLSHKWKKCHPEAIMTTPVRKLAM